jgi:hypothetical protein
MVFQMAEQTREVENHYTLSQPGRLLDALEECMARRLTPHRPGWSASNHLGRDLERFYGVRAPAQAIERALRVLSKRGRLRLRADDAGVIWYRLRED